MTQLVWCMNGMLSYRYKSKSVSVCVSVAPYSYAWSQFSADLCQI